MLSLNAFNKIGHTHFPDGTQMLLNIEGLCTGSEFVDQIFWHYENDEECMTLFFLVKHIRSVKGENTPIDLVMKYLPNARMDRVKHENEVFTLKYFCEFINSLNFRQVHVLDPHSDVGVALLNHVCVDSPERHIKYVLTSIRGRQAELPPVDAFVIYFPDAGAYKRYREMDCLKSYKKVYGQKVRNWETGAIESLRVVDENATAIDGEDALKGKIIVMIDDIISYGGTLYYSALRLKELGADKIYAYATHTENSILDEEKGSFIKVLNDNTVEGLYTTDSIFSLKHKKITVL